MEYHYFLFLRSENTEDSLLQIMKLQKENLELEIFVNMYGQGIYDER